MDRQKKSGGLLAFTGAAVLANAANLAITAIKYHKEKSQRRKATVHAALIWIANMHVTFEIGHQVELFCESQVIRDILKRAIYEVLADPFQGIELSPRMEYVK